MILRFNLKDRFPKILRNKYILTLIIFFVWLLLFDSNNLITRYKDMRELHKLKADREFYIKHIEDDKKKLYELKTDDHNLEKFAREQYHMKKPDEDLYIILTPSEDRKITRKNN